MAVEDAAALAEAVSMIGFKDELQTALDLFSERPSQARKPDARSQPSIRKVVALCRRFRTGGS